MDLQAKQYPVSKLSRFAIQAALFLFSIPALAHTAPMREIRVTLFGQPCLLQGPVDEGTLKKVHAISPEQLYPALNAANPNPAVARKALEKLRATQGIPSALDQYRERLAKRLESQIAFLRGWELAKKARKSDPLLKATRKYIYPRHERNFETLSKRMEAKDLTPSKLRDLGELLLDTYNDSIVPDPEEDFHRGIQRLNIQYVCSFEGTMDNGDDGDDGGGD